MLSIVASARPEYDPDLQTLTFAIPISAAKGDVLLLLVAHADASSITIPDGWTDSGQDSAGGVTLRRAARMLDGTENLTLVVDLDAAGDEVQGALVVLRGAGSIPLLIEASDAVAFADTWTPSSGEVPSQQAISLVLGVWSVAGAPTLTLLPGATAIESYTTALLSARTFVVAYRRANDTRTSAPGEVESDAAVSGAAFALTLRNGLPPQPLELFDPVPGNIGLLGKDRRPPREAS